MPLSLLDEDEEERLHTSADNDPFRPACTKEHTHTCVHTQTHFCLKQWISAPLLLFQNKTLGNSVKLRLSSDLH